MRGVAVRRSNALLDRKDCLLPNTRLTLHYANGFHSYSPREHPEFRPYQYDLSVNDVAPDLPAEATIDQYLRLTDPALEAILAFEPRAAAN